MRARGFRWDRALLALALTCVATPAAAAPSDRALAESLFLEARDLFAADKIPEACAKFGESYRLDAALGTLLNLAVCHEKEGKLASAWAEFRDAAAEARAQRQPEREAMARRHVEALAPQLAHVVLVAPPDAPSSLVVKLDGSNVGRAAFGSKLPIDPGDHKVEATATDKKPWSRFFTVTGTNDVPIEIPTLEAAPVIAHEPLVTTGDARTDEAPSSSQRTIGWVVAGAGVVGLGVSAVFGAKVLSSKSDRDDHCRGTLCDPEGVTADKDARDAATISTIAFVAGAALVAGGVVLVLTAPRARARATLAPTFGGAVLGGVF